MAWVASPLFGLERAQRQPDLIGARGDDMREFAGAEADGLEAIQPDQRRRGVNRIHHVVERPRQREDVLAVERRDEGAVEALDDFVREEVALVLDLLDLVGLVPGGMFRRQHFLEQTGAAFQLVAKRLEIRVELFFAGKQSEGHQRAGL